MTRYSEVEDEGGYYPPDYDTGGWGRRPEPPKPIPPLPEPGPEWGRFPEGECADCGGRYAHHALCPTGVEEEARRQADHHRIAMIRRVMNDPAYSPYHATIAAAEAYEREGWPEVQLRHPGDWSAHYRTVAARVRELLPMAEAAIRKDGTPGCLAESALQYLDRPVPASQEKVKAALKKRQSQQAKNSKKTKRSEAGMFTEFGEGSDSPHV